MKQIPRYDPSDVDPLSLNASLSLLFNNTMTNLWMESPYKEQIFIGSHNIECTGAIREARYRHTKSGRCDYIHLWGASGSKVYTLSVLHILRAAHVTSSEHNFHQTCAQYKYQGRHNRNSMRQSSKRKQTQPSTPAVHTHNRFNGLRNMDQRN